VLRVDNQRAGVGALTLSHSMTCLAIGAGRACHARRTRQVGPLGPAHELCVGNKLWRRARQRRARVQVYRLVDRLRARRAPALARPDAGTPSCHHLDLTPARLSRLHRGSPAPARHTGTRAMRCTHITGRPCLRLFCASAPHARAPCSRGWTPAGDRSNSTRAPERAGCWLAALAAGSARVYWASAHLRLVPHGAPPAAGGRGPCRVLARQVLCRVHAPRDLRAPSTGPACAHLPHMPTQDDE